MTQEKDTVATARIEELVRGHEQYASQCTTLEGEKSDLAVIADSTVSMDYHEPLSVACLQLVQLISKQVAAEKLLAEGSALREAKNNIEANAVTRQR